MSITASLSVTLASKGSYSLSSTKIINNLTNSNWNLEKNNKIYYLPQDDDDEFDWQERQITKDVFLGIVEKKEKAGELIGVALTWENTEIGVILLIDTDYQLSFSLAINRKTLPGNLTDFNWYLEKILPCLETEVMTVTSFSFGQN